MIVEFVERFKRSGRLRQDGLETKLRKECAI
jgi:hypothetical protein